MNRVEENERTIEADIKKTPQDSEGFYYDITLKSIHNLAACNELLCKTLLQKRPGLLFFHKKSSELLDWVFTELKINPLIKAECSEWSFKEKDYIIEFESYFFVTFSDISVENNFQKPTQAKIIVFSDLVVVVACEEVFFIDHLFSQHLSQGTLTRRSSDITDFHKALTIKRFQRLIDLQVPLEKCFSAYDLLYIIFKVSIQRYEKFVLNLVNESKNCLKFSLEISYKEFAEYQIRVSKAERCLIYLENFIKPKKKTLVGLENYFINDKFFVISLKGLGNRLENLEKLMSSSSKIFNSATALYRTCAEDTLTRTSFSSGELMKYFSGLTTIIVPLLLVEGMFSTNLVFPGEMSDSLKEFIIIVSSTLSWILICLFYFKKLNWF